MKQHTGASHFHFRLTGVACTDSGLIRQLKHEIFLVLLVTPGWLLSLRGLAYCYGFQRHSDIGI
jgi:hypothetical protein